MFIACSVLGLFYDILSSSVDLFTPPHPQMQKKSSAQRGDEAGGPEQKPSTQLMALKCASLSFATRVI